MTQAKMDKKILLTGATGLIGNALCQRLISEGFNLVILGRGSKDKFRQRFNLPCEYFEWSDPIHSAPPSEALDVDFVIHLMGEPIAGIRWTKAKKKELWDSRVLSTRNLVTELNKCNSKLQTFVSASAIGFYGDRSDEILSESSPAATDFLGQVCQAWEEEAKKINCRSVQLRQGLVLSEKGGALAKMRPVFEKGLGGPIAGGRGWMSWIHIEDLIGIFSEAITNPDLEGPVNAVAPNPVTNNEFTQELAKALKVKAPFPVPAMVLKLLLGEMSQIVLGSQRVIPHCLNQIGFKFKYVHLTAALDELISQRRV